MCGLISALSPLFHGSVCLPLWQCHSILNIIIRKSGNLSSLNFKSVVAIQSPLRFCVNFEDSNILFSVLTWNNYIWISYFKPHLFEDTNRLHLDYHSKNSCLYPYLQPKWRNKQNFKATTQLQIIKLSFCSIICVTFGNLLWICFLIIDASFLFFSHMNFFIVEPCAFCIIGCHILLFLLRVFSSPLQLGQVPSSLWCKDNSVPLRILLDALCRVEQK